MEQKSIKQLTPGEQVTVFYMLRKKELKTKRDHKTLYLSLELGDCSGRIWGTLWDKPREIFDKVTVGHAVKIKAVVITLNDKLHLSIDKIRSAKLEDKIDETQLIPVSSRDREAQYDELLKLIDRVSASSLRQLLQQFFHNKDLKQKFIEAPAGKLWHHNYRGGLLEHTLAVTQIAMYMTHHYPQLKKDLLITAGLLHDIGKIAEYRTEGFIDFTDRGRLLGHIVMGSQMIKDMADNVKDFPISLKEELLHLILSHQGKLEHGSPVVPMTLEAIVLYYADELDSKANAFQRILNQHQESGEKWTGYVKLMERFLFLGEKSDDQGL